VCESQVRQRSARQSELSRSYCTCKTFIALAQTYIALYEIWSPKPAVNIQFSQIFSNPMERSPPLTSIPCSVGRSNVHLLGHGYRRLREKVVFCVFCRFCSFFWGRRECKNENIETRLLLKAGEGKNMRRDASKFVKGGEDHILARLLRRDENGLLEKQSL